MMRPIIPLLLLLASSPAFSAADPHNQTSGANLHDIASVQRGAALFVNYCQACHSAQYMRYQRLAQDLDLTEEQVLTNLALGGREIGDYMLGGMTAEQTTDWLGAPAPDLTLTARSRGGDWIYTFLNTFYLTDDGWNNLRSANSSMPHVLWELQGIQVAIEDDNGEGVAGQTRVTGFELVQPGRMTPEQYRLATRDIVAFMEYMAEPAALKRKQFGIWVIMFLVLLAGLTWLVYKEYWKDVK